MHTALQNHHSKQALPTYRTESFTGQFQATAPNHNWVSDISYVWTEEGWLYLAVVLDLYSRVVVG